MNILVAAAWMWMAAQTGSMTTNSIQWTKPSMYVQIVNDKSGTLKARDSDGNEAILPVHCDPLNPDAPYWTNCRVTHAPAEHVIEIRDGRKYYERRHPKDCYPAGVFYQTRKDGSVDCFRVTREIWIDGKKWGVLKESNK